MRQALADTAAAGQDDRPSAGGDVDMVDQGAAAPDPQVPTGVSLSKAQNESLAKMAGERKRTPRALTQCQTHTARGAPGSRTARGPAHGVPRIGLARVRLRSVPVGPQRCPRTSGWGQVD